MIDIFGIIDKLLDNRKIVFFDIGGAGGSHPRWELLSNHIEIFYSEPNSDSYEKLQTLNSKKFNYAIGDKKGKNLLFITSKDECSSILRPNFTFLNNFPNPDRFNIVSEQSIEVTTIDDFSKIIDKKIHALKIDVQGAAYQVLNSGRQVISNDSLCVEVETEFCEVYAGQQLFPEIFNYLIEFGYKLVDINPIRWKRNSTTNIGSEIVFCDALFVKDPELISNDREKLSNLCVLLMAYGNFNYAFSIIEKYCLIESFEEISKNINDMESIIEQYNLNFSDGQFFAELKRLHKKLDINKYENDSLREKIDKLVSNINSCNKDNSVLREKYKSSQDEVVAQRDKLVKLRTDLKLSNSSNFELREKYKYLNDELLLLKNKHHL